MSWKEHHKLSEYYSDLAEWLRIRGVADVTDKYAFAAAAEEKALAALAPEKIRTRGITAVSAAALWLKAGAPSRARELIDEYAKRDDVSPSARVELESLRSKTNVTAIKRPRKNPLPIAHPERSLERSQAGGISPGQLAAGIMIAAVAARMASAQGGDKPLVLRRKQESRLELLLGMIGSGLERPRRFVYSERLAEQYLLKKLRAVLPSFKAEDIYKLRGSVGDFFTVPRTAPIILKTVFEIIYERRDLRRSFARLNGEGIVDYTLPGFLADVRGIDLEEDFEDLVANLEWVNNHFRFSFFWFL